MRNYRGIPVGKKDFVYGWYVFEKLNNRHLIFYNAGLLADWRFAALVGYVEVIPSTVGQAIGLKDKNGKEIYEGDTVTTANYPYIDEGKQNYIAEIQWIFAGFQVVLKCVNPDKRGISDGVNEPIENGSEYEITGNIHQK